MTVKKKGEKKHAGLMLRRVITSKPEFLSQSAHYLAGVWDFNACGDLVLGSSAPVVHGLGGGCVGSSHAVV